MKIIPKFVKKHYFLFLAATLVIIFAGLSYSVTNGINILGIHTTNESITFDEVAHIASAYQYDHDHKIVLNPEHPILIKALVGVPLQFIHIKPSSYSFNFLINTYIDYQWDYGKQIIFENNPTQTRKIILISRISVLAINTALLIIAVFIARKVFNKKVALIMLALIVFNPSLLGHASLVTFDVPALLTSIITLLCFCGLIKYNNPKMAIATGIASGIACSTKYSSVALAVFIFVFYLVYSIIKKSDHNLKRRLYFLFLYSLFLILTIIIIYLPYTIGITAEQNRYQFYNIWKGHLILFSRPLIDFLNSLSSPTKALASWLDGVFITNAQVKSNRPGVFLLGHAYSSGLMLPYFPVVFIAKNTIAELLIFICSFALFIKLAFKGKMKNFIVESSLIIYVLIYFVLAMSSKLKLGFRHLYPIEGVLSLFSALIINKNWGKKIFNFKLSTLFLILIAIAAAETVYTYPRYISFYNLGVGGVNNGYKIVEDSNYDWGQDFVSLRNWINTNPHKVVYYDIFAVDGSGQYYLPNYNSRTVAWNNLKLPKGSYVAIDSNRLTAVETQYGIKYQQVFKNPPLRLTPTIFIFKI